MLSDSLVARSGVSAFLVVVDPVDPPILHLTHADTIGAVVTPARRALRGDVPSPCRVGIRSYGSKPSIRPVPEVPDVRLSAAIDPPTAAPPTITGTQAVS